MALGGVASPSGPVVVVGSGGMARETVVWARRSGRNVFGLLDEDPERHGLRLDGLEVLGGLAWLRSDRARTMAAGLGIGTVVAVGSPNVRRRVAARLAADGHPLVTIIDPSAILGDRVSLGPGTIVCPRATLTCDVEVGDGVILSVGASLHHDDVVGDHVFVGPGAQVSGNVTIGDGAWIGVGATLNQGVTIGAGTVVGAGAVVVDDLPADVTAVGVPARAIDEHDPPW